MVHSVATIESTESTLRWRRLLVTALVLFTFLLPMILTLSGVPKYFFAVDDSHRAAVGDVVGADFPTFYTAGVLTAQGESHRVYDNQFMVAQERELVSDASAPLLFFYPPHALLYWLPLALFSYLTAFWVWTIGTAGVFAFLAYRVTRHWSAPLLVLVTPSLIFGAAAGQNGILIAIFLVAGLLLLPDRPRSAGAFFALMTFKPHLAIVAPIILIASGEWRAFRAYVVTVFMIASASTLAFGPEAWIVFLQKVLVPILDPLAEKHMVWTGMYQGGAETDLFWQRVISIFPLSRIAIGTPGVAFAVQCAFALLAVGAAVHVWRETDDPAWRALALTSATLLMSPKALDYDMVLHLAPLVFFYRTVLSGRLNVWIALLMSLMWSGALVRWYAIGLGWQPAPLINVLFLAGAAYWVSRHPRES